MAWSSGLSHFGALSYKNWLLKKRKPITTLSEVLLPALFIFILVVIKDATSPQDVEEYVATEEDFKIGPFVYSETEVQTLTELHEFYGTDDGERLLENFCDIVGEPGEGVLFRCNDDNGCSCQRKQIGVAPGDPSLESLVDAFIADQPSTHTPGASIPMIRKFDSPGDAVGYIRDDDYSYDTDIIPLSAIITLDSGPPDWEFTIRVNKSAGEFEGRNIPDTSRNTNGLLRGHEEIDDSGDGNDGYEGSYLETYARSGFLLLQNTAAEFVRKTEAEEAGTPTPVTSRYYHEFPSEEYTGQGFWDQIGTSGNVFGIFVVVALVYPFSSVVRLLVLEKEQKIREGMRMMALSETAFYMSWTMCFFIIDLVATILIVIVSTGLPIKLFDFSDTGLIFGLFLFFNLASTALAFSLAAVFDRSMTAAIISAIVYIVGYAIYEVVYQDDVSVGVKRLSCLHPVTCFTLATIPLAEFEEAEIGITSDTINASETNNFTFQDALSMLIVDIFIFYFAGWYLDQVAPRTWGVPKPWYFLVQPSYWRGVFGCQGRYTTPVLSRETILSTKKSNVIEEVPREQHEELAGGKGIAIRALRKVYHTNAGEKVAVQGLDLDAYENEVTALLGHNGAGKTTVISMLTGMLPTTAGTASIYGKDIRRDMADIRHEMGVCPQHDILFDELTVEEHLRLFATFKGVPLLQRDKEVEKMIRMVGLTEKRQNRSKELSGGMKRKLSVGIAFIGGSRVIILDEPTSGMDPYSRRFTWDLIRKNKGGRVILLTTHFMDEADLLGDRIAIMGEGALKCVGSSLFLKQLFGVGYQLTMEKGASFKYEEASGLIESRLPESKLLNNVGTELTFEVPFSSSHAFSSLFRTLDEKSESWGIESYGVSVTTLEEVFIKVARGESAMPTEQNDATLVRVQPAVTGTAKIEPEEKETTTSKVSPLENEEDMETSNTRDNHVEAKVNEGASDMETGQLLWKAPEHKIEVYDRDRAVFYFFLHIRALLYKRVLVFRRDYKPWICQYLIPLIFVCGGIGAISAVTSSYNDPLLVLNTNGYNGGGSENNPWMYNDPNTEFNSEFSDDTDDICEDFGYPPAPSCPLKEDVQLELHGTVMDLARTAGEVDPYADFNGTNVNDTIEGFGKQLLQNRNLFADSQYGAIEFGYSDTVVNASSGETVPTYLYIIYSNYSALHGSAVFDAVAQEAILKTIDSDATFTVKNHPMPETEKQAAVNEQTNTFSSIMILLLAMPFIPAGFVITPVREKATKAKHQQVVSGVSYPAYWLSHWLFDLVTYQPAWTVIFGLLAAFGLDGLTKNEEGAAVATLFVLYGFSVTGFTYCTSFFFAKPASAQILTIMLHFMTGLLAVLAFFILTIIEETQEIAEDLAFVMRVFPTFCLGHGIMWIALSEVWRAVGVYDTTDPFALELALYDIYFLAWQSVAYIGIAILMDIALSYKSVRSVILGDHLNDDEIGALDVEEDVQHENERVASGAADDELIVIRDVKHKYATGKIAVKGISLGIQNGQCFGLLGINGAGKTTLLSVLSGEFPPSRGTATLDGHDLLADPLGVRRLIGYCPQFDALYEHLTGKEHLALYARIKGVPEHEIDYVVEEKAKQMDLLSHYERQAGGYSGGNKRKLSVACAMVGEPRIVFLDEPSTGMDPLAKRFMWEVISAIATRQGKCAVILTTHSMEECEALCSRIGIMVGGRFRCLGSAQRLKTKFGLGFQLEASLKLPRDSAITEIAEAMGGPKTHITRDNLEEAFERAGWAQLASKVAPDGSGAAIDFDLTHFGFIEAEELAAWLALETKRQSLTDNLLSNYPGATLRESQGGRMRFEIPGVFENGDKLHLADVFDVLESLKEPCGIREYSLSQTSLEQIFNGFAAQQDEERGHAAGIEN